MKISEYQAQRAATHTVEVQSIPEVRPYARAHVERVQANGGPTLVLRQLVREAASERKVTAADLQADAVDEALSKFGRVLSTASSLKGLPAKVKFNGKGSNPVNSLEVPQLVEAAWSGLDTAWGSMINPEAGYPVQSAAKRIGAHLRDMCGGASWGGAKAPALFYEQAALVLIDYFAHATGWIVEETGSQRFASVRKETNKLRVTQKFLDATLNGAALAEFLERRPMLVPPVPWRVGMADGGFLHAAVQAVRGVRKGIESQDVVDALNALQGTAWRVNSRVLAAARAFSANAETASGTATQWGYIEERHDTDENRQRSWTIRSALTLAAFGELEDADEFFFPWNLDWRGRMYPATTIISPQGSDLCKGLLEFADGTPLGRDGARWLAIHLCNLHGSDKLKVDGKKINRTADERAAWTIEHSEELLAIASDPWNNRAWQKADKPYQFLAACYEWADYQAEGPGFRSRLAGALDGSCSGVQMLSGMTRDASAGAMVNLTPTERGDDYYGRMAEALTRRLCGLVAGASADTMAHLAFWSSRAIDRDLLKSPSMTKVYSAGTYTFGEQVQAKTGASDAECIWLAARINECFGDVAPGMLAAMAYLQGVADVLTEANLPLVWSTPVGLKVEQARYNEESVDLVTRTFGERKRRFYINRDTLSKKGQRAGVSPNFVHGVDASHMVRVVNDLYRRGVRNFAMVHDSFGAPFAQCQDVFESTREQFVELMEADLLGTWTEQVTAALTPEQREKLPPLPEYGTLDLNAVRESGYAWF
jgi:DNA-directed RNA polymerase